MLVIVKTLSGKSTPLQIELGDTIRDLKEIIYALEGYETDTQKLVFLARELRDENTIFSYKITEGSIIYLTFNDANFSQPMINSDMSLLVKTLLGTSIMVTMQSYDTIKSLKKALNKKEDISEDNQRLIFAGTEMKDEDFLVDYNIKDGSTIFLVIKPKEKLDYLANMRYDFDRSLFYPS